MMMISIWVHDYYKVEEKIDKRALRKRGYMNKEAKTTNRKFEKDEKCGSCEELSLYTAGRKNTPHQKPPTNFVRQFQFFKVSISVSALCLRHACMIVFFVHTSLRPT